MGPLVYTVFRYMRTCIYRWLVGGCKVCCFADIHVLIHKTLCLFLLSLSLVQDCPLQERASQAIPSETALDLMQDVNMMDLGPRA